MPEAWRSSVRSEPVLPCGCSVDNASGSPAPIVGYSVDRTSLIVRNAPHRMRQEAYVDNLCTNEHTCSSAYLLEDKVHRGPIHISTVLTGITVFLNLVKTSKERRRR